jgi:hypothetical protein
MDLAFERAGLRRPSIPEPLLSDLESRGDWCWSTEPLATTPYLLEEYVRAFEADPSHDLAVVAHAGHGMASWALCHYVVTASVGIFVHSAWGSALADPEQDAADRTRFERRMERVDALLDALSNRVGDDVVGAVITDFGHERAGAWRPGDEPVWETTTDALAAAERLLLA